MSKGFLGGSVCGLSDCEDVDAQFWCCWFQHWCRSLVLFLFRNFLGGAVSVAGIIGAGVQRYFGVADSSTGVAVLCRFSKLSWVAVSVKGTIW